MTNDSLNAAALQAALTSELPVRYYPTVDSTNSEARRLIDAGRREKMLLVAEEQTAGRGRQGKSFYSPARSGVYFSLVLPWEGKTADAVSVTTGASVAVCRALEELCGVSPQIKWVNDVYLHEKKICGILTEAVALPESDEVVLIIGIGINITTRHFPQEIENAGALGVCVNRTALVSAVCNELLKVTGKPFSDYAAYYRMHSLLTGKEIRFLQNGAAADATALGIDNEGGLLVRLKDGSLQTLRSGEITVRENRETT